MKVLLPIHKPPAAALFRRYRERLPHYEHTLPSLDRDFNCIDVRIFVLRGAPFYFNNLAKPLRLFAPRFAKSVLVAFSNKAIAASVSVPVRAS
ncbi:hypothetical protein PZ897_10710 [Hoeflea sp. YIM 152468]|uniref:hypothetical protein n=1 Tax=Hoeflea sp. YIM 152468 TaxID=3031759 RepID=UPI0023DB58EC|nr:hypothetical protein [Hoeflea sp. YIM 152468]MDF1608648.1 hypothetical protein [Hoeflea sp. YIM 152468]